MRAQISRSARALTAIGLLSAPLTLAACGSSAEPARTAAAPVTVTRTVTRSANTSRTVTRPTTSTPTTTPTSPQPASTRCVASDLTLSFLGGNGATGHAELGFALRNRSTHGCRSGGYPGVLFLAGSGRPLPTHPDHTTSDFFGHSTLRELSVAPGARVSFRLGVSHVGPGGSNTGCVRVRTVQVIAPDDTARMRVAIRGGFFECAGVVSVSPLQPGTTAYH